MYNDTPKSSRTKYLIYRYLFPIRVKLKKKSVDEISITIKITKIQTSHFKKEEEKRECPIQLSFQGIYVQKKSSFPLVHIWHAT